MSTTTLTVRHCNTPSLAITTVAFTRYGKRQHDVTVDEDGTVRVYDSTAGYFTRCHSITPQVQGVIRARWAKAHADKVPLGVKALDV